jgi:ribosomal protein S18 acetylase RimI-like enzyme
MGIVQGQRGQGAGSWFMGKLIDEARERRDHELLLEVIEQNEYAVRLYKKCGFQTVRRLIGLIRKDAKEDQKAALEEIDLREAGSLISQYGLADLPWQLAGETIAQMNPPACAYRNGPSSVVISNPNVEHIVIWSLLVRPESRGKALGVAMLENVIANYPGKTWHVPAIFPEEFGKVFERAGFEREALTQWQMKLMLL